MKKIRIIIGISALALGLSGCSSAYYRADSGTYDVVNADKFILSVDAAKKLEEVLG